MTIELAKLFVMTLLFFSYCTAIGFSVLSALGLWKEKSGVKLQVLLTWFFSINIGLFLSITLLFILGISGLFNTPAILGFGLMMLMAASPQLFKNKTHLIKDLTSLRTSDAIVCAIFFIIILLSAIHPPGDWDDTMYHLPLARSYVENNAIVLNEFLRFPLFPQNMTLLLSLGLLLDGDMGAQALAALPICVIAMGLLGASRWFTGSILLGVFASVTIFLIDPSRRFIGYAYIDNGLALFCWAATLAMAVWVERTQTQASSNWLIIAGLLAGGAAGVKYFGAVFAALLAAYLLFARRDWKSTMIFSGLVILTGSWWYIRSFLISGDPVHPAGGNIFGHFLWDAIDLSDQVRQQASHGVPPSSLNVWGALRKVGAWPWIFAIVGLVVPRQLPAIRFFQCIFLLYFVFWFCITQVERYLAPIFGVATFLSWYFLYQMYVTVLAKRISCYLSSKALSIVSAIMLISMLFPLSLRYYNKAVNGIEKRQITLERYPGYKLFSKANTMMPHFGNRLLQFGFERSIYFFEGTVIGDCFGPGRYRNMVDCSEGNCAILPPDKLKSLMEGFRAKMFAVSKKSQPNFNPDTYTKYFDIILKTENGFLIALKSES